MGHPTSFYIVAKVDSSDDFGNDANVCIVHVTADCLALWNFWETELARHAEHGDVFKLTLHTDASYFVNNNELLGLLGTEDYFLIQDIPQEWAENFALRGWLVNLYADGAVSFECHHKHSNEEYWSRQIPLKRLLAPKFAEVECDWDYAKA